MSLLKRIQRMHIIPQRQPQGQPMIRNIEDILKEPCRKCGYDLTVETAYSKGVPVVTCSNPDGGYTHVRLRLDPQLAQDYDDFTHAMERAYKVWDDEVA